MKDFTRVLEFDKVLERASRHAATAMGAELVFALEPSARLSQAAFSLSETTELVAALNRYGSIPLGGIEDIREILSMARVQAMLTAADLISLHNTIQSCIRLRNFLLKLPTDEYPATSEIASHLQEHTQLLKEISRSISQSGEVMNTASTTLSRIRQDIRRNQQQLTEKLQSYMQNTSVRNALQDPVITVRSDRYCLPVKSEYRTQVPGIVHDYSASGATLFIEPTAIVEIGNKRRELIAKEAEEVEKILVFLSSMVALQEPALLSTLTSAAHVDCVAARALYALKMDCTEPILTECGAISLRGARHPLLEGEVVPIDIRIGTDFDALLITGPNTGGKTVALKTVGLLTLMAAAGMWIPASSGSEVSVFEGVHADIGDEQSIEQSLSTFSAHMTNIADITAVVGSGSLVLLDEIGAGTDPAEGAALARAIMDFLLSRNAKVVATTHYGELKEYAYSNERIRNASVEFDPATLSPTYKLLIGIPGSSNAFTIASRIGLGKEIVDAAVEGMGNRAIQTDELLRRIEETQHIATQERIEAQRASEEANRLRQVYEQQVNEIAAERARVLDKAREKTTAIIRKYSGRLDEILTELARQRLDQRRSEALQKKAEHLMDKMRQETNAQTGPALEEEKLPADEELKIGSIVRIAGMGQDVEVIDGPMDDKVTVLAGTIRINVPISSLRRPQSSEVNGHAKSRRQTVNISLQKTIGFKPEIDLRAKRVELALRELDKFIDNAVTAGVQSVRIIHGKGTGAMRKAVNDFLNDCSAVESASLESAERGGSGATVAVLK